MRKLTATAAGLTLALGALVAGIAPASAATHPVQPKPCNPITWVCHITFK